MKKFSPFLVGAAFILLIACDAKVTVESNSDQEASVSEEVVFDKELADELGADAYGMRMYVMAFLKEGPNRDIDSTARANLQRQHMDNITKMAEAGKLSVAGPFEADGNPVRGIYIFNVETIEEARALTETDPAIKAGSLVMELRQWYGSAALQLLLKEHKRIAEKRI